MALIFTMFLQFLLSVSELFGDSYLVHIMLPVFLVAVGDNADRTFLPSTVHSRIKGTNAFAFCMYFTAMLYA